MIQRLQRVGHLSKRFQHRLLVISCAGAHCIDGGTLFGAQGATVKNRGDNARCQAPDIAGAIEQRFRRDRLLPGRCGQINVWIQVRLGDANGGGRRMKLGFG